MQTSYASNLFLNTPVQQNNLTCTLRTTCAHNIGNSTVPINCNNNTYPCPGTGSISGSGCSWACTGNVSGCVEIKGIDYTGVDLNNVGADKSSDCCTVCNANSNCVGYTWTPWKTTDKVGTCWLKSTLRDTKINSTAISAKVRNNPTITCEEKINTDLVGGDYKNIPGTSSSDCCTACQDDNTCTAYTWTDYNGGTCWFKNSTTSTQTVSGVVSAQVRTPGITFIVGTLNVQTDEDSDWNARLPGIRKVIEKMGADFLGIQEAGSSMVIDMFNNNNSGMYNYFGLNSPVTGPNSIYLESIALADPNDPKACDFISNGKRCCGYWGEGPDRNAASPVKENINYTLFYRQDPNIQLITGSRKGFTFNTCCAHWQFNRYYQWGLFSYYGKKIVFYVGHLEQSKDYEKCKSYGHTGNETQQKELYTHMMANYKGTPDAPTYHYADGKKKQFPELKGIPFVLASDLNEKDPYFWRNAKGVTVDLNCWNQEGCNTNDDSKTGAKQVDYIISSNDPKLHVLDVQYISTYIDGQWASDHTAGLIAKYQIE